MAMKVSLKDILKVLSKSQRLGIATEVTEVNGDFIISFNPELYGRSGQIDSVTITSEEDWVGYGWTFERFVGALDERLASETVTDKKFG